MAHWLLEQGWDEVKLSVPPSAIDTGEALTGVDPVPLDDAFEERFNSPNNWRYRYTFYRDQPGNYDLVARRRGQLLIVDGKGQSVTNKRGAVAQMIGGLVLRRDVARGDRRYAILIPEGGVCDAALENFGGLDWIELYRIQAAPPGEIRQDTWSAYEVGR